MQNKSVESDTLISMKEIEKGNLSRKITKNHDFYKVFKVKSAAIKNRMAIPSKMLFTDDQLDSVKGVPQEPSNFNDSQSMTSEQKLKHEQAKIAEKKETELNQMRLRRVNARSEAAKIIIKNQEQSDRLTMIKR